MERINPIPEDCRASMTIQEDRQLLQRRATGAREYDRARGIIELQASERDGDQMPGLSDEVSHPQNGKDIAILPAEDEIVDQADCLPLFVDNRPELQRFGSVTSGYVFGVEGHEADLLCRGSACHQQDKREAGQDA
jgi:hypothetical protein